MTHSYIICKCVIRNDSLMIYPEHGTVHIPIAEARAILPQLTRRLAEEERAVAIPRYVRPVLAVMSWELFESIAETLEIVADDDVMAALQVGIEDVREGNLVPIEQVVAALDSTESKNFGDSTWGIVPADQETVEKILEESGYLDA